MDAVGGFTVTISWGNTQDGEPIVLGAAISETGVWPPAPSQIGEPVFCTGDQGGGQPEARVNDYTYLRDRFQSASVDVHVTWSEYCAGDPFDEQDTVPYTLVVYQLPEYVSGASEPVELRRIEGRYPVGYRGNSLAMEQRVATVKVAPAPGGGGGGGGLAVAAGAAAAAAGGWVAIRHGMRRRRRDQLGGVVEDLRRRLDELRRRRQQAQEGLDRHRERVRAAERDVARAQALVDGARTQVEAARSSAADWDYRRDVHALTGGLVATMAVFLALMRARPGQPGSYLTQRAADAIGLVAGLAFTVTGSWWSWGSTAVTPRLEQVLDAAQRLLDECRAEVGRLAAEQARLEGELARLDGEIAEAEARRSAAMREFTAEGRHLAAGAGAGG